MASTLTPESKPDPKPESKLVDENPDRLKYKTWNLRVSIHCEGCKKKVKKILTSVEGVYTTDIDLKLQKVTVVGDVDAQTLLRKLAKTGKHAELWPEIAEQKEKKQGKGKNKEKQGSPESSSTTEETPAHGGDKGKEAAKIKAPVHQEPPKTKNNGGNVSTTPGAGNADKSSDGGTSGKVGVQVKESKAEIKQGVNIPAGGQPPAAGREGSAEKSGAGGVGKKKKKKGHKGNSTNNAEGGEHSSDVTAGSGSIPGPTQVPHAGHANIPSQSNHSPARHPFPDYPLHYHAPPVYAVSYNTAYPSSSYSASYYAPPPPYSTYAHSGPAQPSDYGMYPPAQPSDSFEIFSDENPNACSIM